MWYRSESRFRKLEKVSLINHGSVTLMGVSVTSMPLGKKTISFITMNILRKMVSTRLGSIRRTCNSGPGGIFSETSSQKRDSGYTIGIGFNRLTA